jgi:hypothetical protein
VIRRACEVWEFVEGECGTKEMRRGVHAQGTKKPIKRFNAGVAVRKEKLERNQLSENQEISRERGPQNV